MKDHKINWAVVQFGVRQDCKLKSIAAKFLQTDNQIQHTFPDIYHMVAIIFYYQFGNDSKTIRLSATAVDILELK